MDVAGENDETASIESVNGSVTRWVGDLKFGNSAAVDAIWKRYFHRLIGLAQDKLRKLNHQNQAYDGEDIAQSAFISLCEGAADGRFDRLGDRDDLWRLLVVITSRKASDLRVRDRRQKRGAGRIYKESDMAAANDGGSVIETPLQAIIGNEPTPEFAAMLAEEYARLLERLPKEELRTIAVLRMEGYTNEEIAGKLGCALRTVARRLEWIRESFRAQDAEDSAARDVRS